MAAVEHLAAVRADVRLPGRTDHGGRGGCCHEQLHPGAGLSRLGAGAAGQGVLAAVDVEILMARSVPDLPICSRLLALVRGW